MYKATPESEGSRVAREETLGYAVSLTAIGGMTYAASTALEGILLSRLQRKASSLQAQLEILQSPTLLKYLKSCLSNPLISIADRRNLWETLTGEKLSNYEDAKHVLRTTSKIRRFAIGTLSMLVMLEAYHANERGSRAYNELLLNGVAPFSLTPQCVPSRGTLSIRLLKDSNHLPLAECVIPIAIEESNFRRRYDNTTIGILPIERRAAPYLISQAIQDYQQSLPHNKRHTGVKKVVVQSMDLSVSSEPHVQQADLNRNFSVGEEIKLRLGGFKEKSSDYIQQTDNQTDVWIQHQFHHVHLSMSDVLRQSWKVPTASTNVVGSPESSNVTIEDEQDELFLASILRSLFPSLPLMKEFATSEEGKRISQLIRSAYFHHPHKPPSSTGDEATQLRGDNVHLHLLDLRPLLVTQLITSLLTTLPVTEPSDEEEDDIGPKETGRINNLYAYTSATASYLFENYIEPWDFLWDLSLLSAKVASKYLLIATDTIGSIVRASALDPMLGVDDSNLVVQEKLKDIGLKTGIGGDNTNASQSTKEHTSQESTPSAEKDDGSSSQQNNNGNDSISANSRPTNGKVSNKVKSKVTLRGVRGTEEDELIGLVPSSRGVNRLSALFNHESTAFHYDDVSCRGSASIHANVIQRAMVESPHDSILSSVLSSVQINSGTVLDQQYLVQGLSRLGLAVSPLSQLESSLASIAASIPPPPTVAQQATADVDAQPKRTWTQFMGKLTWQCLQFSFHQFRTSCLFIHDLLADVSGVDHPSRRRKLLLNEEQHNDKQNKDQTNTTIKKIKKIEVINHVIVTVVSNAEEVPYRLYMLTQRFPDCHIALVLSSNFSQPIDSYTQTMLKTSIMQYCGNCREVSGDGRKIVLVNPQEVVDKLWNAFPV